MSRRPSSALRRTGLVPLTLAVAAGLSACSATNPITTAGTYEASDGVRAEVGEDVRLGNLLVLSAGEGEPGVLIGQVTNEGDELARVAFGGEGVTVGTDVTVDARGTTLLTPEQGEEVSLDAVPVPPGAYLALEVSVQGGGSTSVQVPVLDGTLPEYADLVPGGEG